MLYKEKHDKKQLYINYKPNENQMKLDIIESKIKNKKNELKREREKLIQSKKYFEQYKNNEIKNIQYQENELIKEKIIAIKKKY